MSNSRPTAARRPGIVRAFLVAVLRPVWRALRVVLMVMAALGPSAPPPPLPRPPPIVARAEDGEGEDEEP
jgi:hypothetical protein